MILQQIVWHTPLNILQIAMEQTGETEPAGSYIFLLHTVDLQHQNRTGGQADYSVHI